MMSMRISLSVNCACTLCRMMVRAKCFPEIVEKLPILRERSHLELRADVFKIVRVAELELRVREIPKHCGL